MPRELESHHTIYYSNRAYVPIPELAASLVALEKTVKHITPTFQMLFKEADILAIQVFVEQITAGSVDDHFLLKLIFKTDEGYDIFVEKLRRYSGIEFVQEKHPFIGQLLTAGIILGAVVAVNRWGINSSNVHVEGDHNIVLNVDHGDMNITPDEIREAFSESVKNKAALASSAVKLIHPAKLDDQASITVDGNESFRVSKDAIKEMPVKATRTAPSTGCMTLENESFDIRALDRDNTSKGWYVVVPSLAEKRFRLELDPRIDPEVLRRGGQLKGKLEAHYRITEDGDRVYTNIYLVSLSE